MVQFQQFHLQVHDISSRHTNHEHNHDLLKKQNLDHTLYKDFYDFIHLKVIKM